MDDPHRPERPIDVREAIEGWIAEILQRQHGDAEDKTQAAWYWGDTGGCVAKAASGAGRAIATIARDPDPHVYLDRLDVALAVALEKYRADCEDPDGFGAATFHGIRRDVKALHARLPQSGGEPRPKGASRTKGEDAVQCGDGG